MAKSSNSKVIFLPAMNQGMVNSSAAPINNQFVEASGEGPSSYQSYQNVTSDPSEFGLTRDNGMSMATNSKMVESI